MNLHNCRTSIINSNTSASNTSISKSLSLSSHGNNPHKSKEIAILSGTTGIKNTTRVLLYETHFNISFIWDRSSKPIAVAKKLLVEMH